MLWFVLLIREYMRSASDWIVGVRWEEEYPHVDGAWIDADEIGFPLVAKIPATTWGTNRSLERDDSLLVYIDEHPEWSLAQSPSLGVHLTLGDATYVFSNNPLNGEPLSLEDEVRLTYDLSDPALELWMRTWRLPGALDAGIRGIVGGRCSEMGLPNLPRADNADESRRTIEKLLLAEGAVEGGAALFRVFSDGASRRAPSFVKAEKVPGRVCNAGAVGCRGLVILRWRVALSVPTTGLDVSRVCSTRMTSGGGVTGCCER
jgi:hypothetical protein